MTNDLTRAAAAPMHTTLLNHAMRDGSRMFARVNDQYGEYWLFGDGPVPTTFSSRSSTIVRNCWRADSRSAGGVRQS